MSEQYTRKTPTRRLLEARRERERQMVEVDEDFAHALQEEPEGEGGLSEEDWFANDEEEV